jgi:catabolite regulation protein CreA
VPRARTGGIEAGLGLAEHEAEASIACRQNGAIAFPKPIERQDEMCSRRISPVFEQLCVARMVDAERNTLTDLTCQTAWRKVHPGMRPCPRLASCGAGAVCRGSYRCRWAWCTSGT